MASTSPTNGAATPIRLKILCWSVIPLILTADRRTTTRSHGCRRRDLGLGLRRGRERDLGTELSGDQFLVPDIGDGDLVLALVAAAKLDHLGAFPVAIPVAVGLEPGHLRQGVTVVAAAVHRVFGGAVAKRQRCRRHDLGGKGVLAQHRGIPVDVHHAGHGYAPTSAWIAPGPSAVLPRPSSLAPTRIEILPRCLLSSISWCASGTPSKPSVRQRTGRILPCSIS